MPLVKELKAKIFFVSVLSCVIACAPQAHKAPQAKANSSLNSRVEAPKDLLRINSLLVVPMEFDERVRNERSDQFRFYSEITDALHDQLSIEILSGKDKLAGLAANARPSRKDYLRLAQQNGADAILITRLNSYVERDGTRVGANEPAKVDLEMEVMEANGGKVVWKTGYHFEDQALSENLFGLKDRLDKERGPGWGSAHEQLVRGLRAAASDFAHRRTAVFAAGES